MARIAYKNAFNQEFSSAPSEFKIIIRETSIIGEYAGVTFIGSGKFQVAPDGKGAIGELDSFSLGNSSGSVTVMNAAAPVADMISAIRNKDLSSFLTAAMSSGDTITNEGAARYGGRGNDVFDEATQGFFFGGDGVDTVKVGFSKNIVELKSTDAGTAVTRMLSNTVLLILVDVEKIQFTDGIVDVSTTSSLFNYTKDARAGILRDVGSDVAISADYFSGTKEKVISKLMAKAEDSTLPAVIVYDEIMGKTPGSAHLDTLAGFVKGQINSPGYQSTASPRLGGYEAMGLGLSGTAEFAAKFGARSDADMVRTEYQHLFARAATDAQVNHFVGQIDYFEALYVGAGISAADAGTKARGAVVGQMVGFAAGEHAGAHTEAVAWLTAAANGSASYGSPLGLM